MSLLSAAQESRQRDQMRDRSILSWPDTSSEKLSGGMSNGRIVRGHGPKDMSTCRWCRKPLKAGSKSCRKCGSVQAPCPSCGDRVPLDRHESGLCADCGTMSQWGRKAHAP